MRTKLPRYARGVKEMGENVDFVIDAWAFGGVLMTLVMDEGLGAGFLDSTFNLEIWQDAWVVLAWVLDRWRVHDAPFVCPSSKGDVAGRFWRGGGVAGASAVVGGEWAGGGLLR